MIEFYPLSIENKDLFAERFYTRTSLNAGNGLVNLCAYNEIYPSEYAVDGEALLTRIYLQERNISYYEPIGGDIRNYVDRIETDAKEKQYCFGFVLEDETKRDYFLSKGYKVEYSDSLSEYVYNRESLQTLKGRKLQSKRNHVNKFVSLYPSWQYVALDSKSKENCLVLSDLWQQQEMNITPQYKHDYIQERKIIEFLFDNFDSLDLIGGAIVVEGKIVAYSLGNMICSNTIDVNIEKADRRYQGAYTLINREFVAHLPENVLFVNREEDKGIVGLRKAKLSYNPSFMVSKYIAYKDL